MTSEVEHVVDSGQGSEDDVEKEPAVDDGGEEAEEETEEGYNMLQWSVINAQVQMLRQYVWLGVFAELDVKVTKQKSKFFGKDPYEIADEMGADEMMAEIERCRLWESSITPFQRVVRQAKGNGSICCLLANMSKDTLNATDSEGYSCIHWATVTGNERLLTKILSGLALKNGSSSEVLLIPTKNDGTSIELAAEMGHSKFLQSLLSLFTRDIAQSESSDVAEIGQVLVASVLEIVARNGDTESLEAVVQVVGKPPQRLLKVAVENNRALVVAHLILQHGLEPDDVKTDESSPSPGWPLRTACLDGWEDMVTLLVALPNSNPALTNERDGRNCIHWAAVNGSEHLMVLLLTQLAKRNLLQTMINARDVYLRDAPIKLICGKDGEGEPVWYYVLLRRNQEPFLDNQNEDGNFNITNYGAIIKTGQGVEPDEDTKNYIADCMDGRAELDTQEPDCTPLHLAIAERNYQAAIVLIKAGADVNARDHFGMTSLHYAVREESRDMCQILIEHGADVKAKDGDGHTAEDVAKVKDAGELASLLGALATN